MINLLDEPDENAFARIREKIFSFGQEAIPVLEIAWENSFEGIVQERIEEDAHFVIALALVPPVVNHAVRRDPVGLAIETAHPDIEAGRVVDDAQLGPLRRRLARIREDHGERRERGGLCPGRIGERRVERRPLGHRP